MAKWWTTDLQKRLTSECLQLHGGYGFMLEYPIADGLRRRRGAVDLRRHQRDHEGDHRAPHGARRASSGRRRVCSARGGSRCRICFRRSAPAPGMRAGTAALYRPRDADAGAVGGSARRRARRRWLPERRAAARRRPGRHHGGPPAGAPRRARACAIWSPPRKRRARSPRRSWRARRGTRARGRGCIRRIRTLHEEVDATQEKWEQASIAILQVASSSAPWSRRTSSSERPAHGSRPRHRRRRLRRALDRARLGLGRPDPAPPGTSLALGMLAVVFGIGAWVMRPAGAGARSAPGRHGPRLRDLFALHAIVSAP